MAIFTEPILSASMVLYNSGTQAAKAVQCFQDSDIPLDLYIIDNAPGDATCQRLLWQCPGIQYRPQPKNLGYGRANNVVIPELRSQYHLICNPDVTFDKTLLSSMVQYMEVNRDCAILTPRVFHADGTEQHLPKRAPTVRYLLGGLFEKLPGPFAAWRSEYTLRDNDIQVPTCVEFATGCFMLIRTGFLRQLGGFDPRYFLYHEDSDLSRRALRLGSIVYHPDMCVTHDWKRSEGRTWHRLRHHIASTFRYFHVWGWKW
ncbi:MAG: glycosyltransferase [Clostridia bacterium]|nr:glycosyltransferase [Clostridia bacterium]